MPFDTDQKSYIALRNIISERTRPIIAWVGAGLSVEAGLPSWDGLKELLIEAGRSKARDLTPDDDANRLRDLLISVEREKSPWVAFQQLEQILGPTTYREVIRDALQPSQNAPTPEAYRYLWQLPIRGIFSLNIDGLAARAAVEKSINATEFSASQAGNIMNLLATKRRFVANLHGTVDDVKTWVFTHKELKYLMKSGSYQLLLKSTLSMFTNLFIGMSADDVAVGGHLETLGKLGIEAPSHFWLTSRRDAQTDAWAESAGIRVIRYKDDDGKHGQVREFFEDIIGHVPEEPKEAPPVLLDRGNPGATGELPTPRDMARWDSENARKTLNSHALELVNSAGGEITKEYETFLREYEEAIHRAWFVTHREPNNKLFGYTITGKLTRGAFGNVFTAHDPEGNLVAIKVLLEDIRDESELLKSFRRGVRSMSILRKRGIRGMVGYIEASEIPAFVVMDFIPGANLAQAKSSGGLEEWSDCLKFASQLTGVILSAHRLPERVLHRDLRPANIMLKDFWDGDGQWEVVVLDFDLSWHRGAGSDEKSVLHGSTSAGYLAPEQIEKIASTRHAGVDAYGLGMTFLYLCSGNDPLPGAHQHRDWLERVHAATKEIRAPHWKSIPNRFARLIIGCTRHTQGERNDIAQVSLELHQLWEAELNPDAVTSVELLVEELAIRTDYLANYTWDEDKSSAFREMPNGLRVQLSAQDAEDRISLDIEWMSTGIEERRTLRKNAYEAGNRVKDKLKRYGWTVVNTSYEAGAFLVSANIHSRAIAGDVASNAKQLDDVLSQLRI
ncbi:protein kinase [Herbidospora sp. NBRC 101105]|uniref:protein kinase domain-containing protein n=1 Tax=Herbidospora sp. NBRC 101105 TaxID=3032195 RepID=UPI0024A0ACA8|nr:protein kinase [Herbidospora sp. NBRC 101105]GLX92521.1 hypothetical protein Hesp01_04710 [Herbidospora sp. NBRC 101105]